MESVLPKRQWRARIAPVPCRTCTGRGRCMELLTLEHFSGHVNDTFSAVLNDDEVPFQLVEARALPSTPGATRKPFALLFRNGSSFLFPQQIYRMRSEEHTSELQSLMRISYAVFCLKTNKHKYTQHQHQQNHIVSTHHI